MVTLVEVGRIFHTRFSDRKSLLVVCKCFVILRHQPAQHPGHLCFPRTRSDRAHSKQRQSPHQESLAWPTPKLAHVSSRSLIQALRSWGQPRYISWIRRPDLDGIRVTFRARCRQRCGMKQRGLWPTLTACRVWFVASPKLCLRRSNTTTAI